MPYRYDNLQMYIFASHKKLDSETDRVIVNIKQKGIFILSVDPEVSEPSDHWQKIKIGLNEHE